MLYFGYLAARIVAALLPIRMSYWIADRVADIWYASIPSMRGMVESNLLLVPGVGNDRVCARALARRVVRNFARMVTEFLYMPKINLTNVERFVDLEGFRSLRREVEEKPAVIVTGHIGNWELGAAVAAMLGVDLYVVVYDNPDRRVARIFRRRREAKGLKVMSLTGAAKTMQSILGRSSIGIVADRDFSGHGIPAAFLGMRMTVPSAYATLAAAAGVPVIPCFCLRHDDGKYHLVVERPISIPPDNKEAARAIVEGYLKILEKHVEKYTEQWYFFQRVGGNSGSCH